MHPNSCLRTLLWICVVGCDAQFSPDYLGESLLTVTGSVEITDDRTEGRLVPALAFSNQSDGQVDIVEVEVEGKFPSDFRLDVYQRPPTAAFFEASHQPGEPRIAVGYITAVASEHPQTIRFATNASSTLAATCVAPGCTKTCETEGGECLVGTLEWCSADGVTCYRESMFCPTREAHAADCRIEAEGDPAIKADPWRYFAGFSQNYLVVYLEERAPAGSWTAALLGSPDGVPAGYGLFAMREADGSAELAAAECAVRAEAVAAGKYNADHGTDYTSIGVDACLTCLGCEEPLPEFCSGTPEELDAWQYQYERYTEQGKLELGCPASNTLLTRVSAPEREAVSVRIGSDPRLF